MGMVVPNPTDRRKLCCDTLSIVPMGSQPGLGGWSTALPWVPSGFTGSTRGPTSEKWVHQWGNMGSQMGMVITNPPDRHEIVSCCLGSKMGNMGSQMGKYGFPNGDCDCKSDRQGIAVLGGFTAGHAGFMARASVFTGPCWF
jgi:hypothetical protein